MSLISNNICRHSYNFLLTVLVKKNPESYYHCYLGKSLCINKKYFKLYTPYLFHSDGMLYQKKKKKMVRGFLPIASSLY